jgi:DNA primase
MITNSSNASNFKQRFNRDKLPDPNKYYLEEGLKLIGAGEWRSALCPFHNDKKPSLRVNTVYGGFKCMACSESGKDVISFHMKRYGLSFKDACKALGTWG